MAVGRRLRWLVLGRPRRGRYTLARRLVQLAVLVLFATQLLVGGVIVAGSLASSRVLRTLPMMDVFAWLEYVAASHGFTLESVVAVLVVFTLYSILGRAFCGWVCPMDLIFSLFERKLVIPRRAPRLTRPHAPGRVEKAVPVLMAAAYILLSLVLGQPFFTTVSPVAGASKLAAFAVGVAYNIPGAALALAEAWALTVFVALAVNVVGEYVLGVKRLWCRFVCPIGALYGFVTNKYSPLRIRVLRPERCLKCNLCSMVCPMSIDVLGYVERGRDITDYRCFHCGRCVEVCPHRVLSLSFRGRR